MDRISHSTIFLMFCLLAVLFRFTSFLPVVIDHDESTYIIIADQWMKGELPYVGTLDVKPIGIYGVFYGFLSILKSVWFIRIMTALVIGITGFLLYRIYFQLFGSRSQSFIAGALYLLLISLHKWGWSANTEIYFVLCSVLALWVLLRSSRIRHYFVIGLLLGIGFLFKYHIVFDILAFVIFDFFRKSSWKNWLAYWSFSFAGFLLPYTTVAILYFSGNHLDEYLFATYTIPSQYASDFSMTKAIAFLGEYFLSFAPISLIYFYSLYFLIKRSHIEKETVILLSVWSLLAWLGILSTGKLYFHYYIQFLPPFCLIAGLIPKFWSSINSSRINLRKVVAAIVITALISNGSQYLQLYKKSDPTEEIASLITADINENDYIYTNDKNILYFLCDAKIPTKYVHTSLLYKDDLTAAYEIDRKSEFERIIETNPAFMVLREEVPQWQAVIEQKYQPVRQFADVTVYQRQE